MVRIDYRPWRLTGGETAGRLVFPLDWVRKPPCGALRCHRGHCPSHDPWAQNRPSVAGIVMPWIDFSMIDLGLVYALLGACFRTPDRAPRATARNG